MGSSSNSYFCALGMAGPLLILSFTRQACGLRSSAGSRPSVQLINAANVTIRAQLDWPDTYQVTRGLQGSHIDLSLRAVMKPLVVIEAFGELPATDLVTAEIKREQKDREDRAAGAAPSGLLHSAFDARAELMAWSSPRLWETYEAGLTGPECESSLIGWVYVRGADPLTTVLPPLVQCLDDSLRRIGVLDVSGIQVATYDTGLQPPGVAGDLFTAAIWFTTPTGLQDGVEALISFDGGYHQPGTCWTASVAGILILLPSYWRE